MTSPVIGRRFRTVAPCITASLALFCWTSQAAAEDRCAAPADITSNIAPLPAAMAALKPGGTLNVLTVGSATVFSPVEGIQPGTITGQGLGLGPASPSKQPLMPTDAAFPMQMAKALQAAVPNLTVNVTVKGGRGMLATEMLDIIRTEVAAHPYQLVIWQTGTVEAVRNIPSGTFYETLADGSAAITQAGANLILVDPQFSRFLHANTDLDPYAQSMQEIAAQPDTILFHRFELMRYWVGEGQIDLERTPKAQRLSTVEALHACLGARLADMVLASAHMPP